MLYKFTISINHKVSFDLLQQNLKPILLNFFVHFSIFDDKLGHFTKNYFFFKHVTNTQAYHDERNNSSLAKKKTF